MNKYLTVLLMVLLSSFSTIAQKVDADSILLDGRLTDSAGKAISRVAVMYLVKDSMVQSTSTNENGHYSMRIEAHHAIQPSATLKFVKSGFQTHSIHLNNYFRRGDYEFERKLKRVDAGNEIVQESFEMLYYISCGWRSISPCINPYNPSSQTTWTAEDISHFPRW